MEVWRKCKTSVGLLLEGKSGIKSEFLISELWGDGKKLGRLVIVEHRL